MNSVLITGSGGFIGGNLKDYFARRLKIFAPRSRELDLCDPRAASEYFRAHKPEAIIHCASVGGARGEADPADTLIKNLAMFDNLAELAGGKIPLITFGSGAGFDRSRSLENVSESELAASAPKDLYGLSKLKIALRRNALCLNIFGCYGRREKPSRFPSYALAQCMRGNDIVISRNAVFSYLYIGDLARITETFLFNPPSAKIINAVPDEKLDMLDIAKIAVRLTGSKSKIQCVQDGQKPSYTASNKLFKTVLPDFEFTPMERGMAELCQWLRGA